MVCTVLFSGFPALRVYGTIPPGGDVDPMKTSRLFHIIHRLLRDGRTTAPVLAEELEVSCRFCGRKEVFTRADIDRMVAKS